MPSAPQISPPPSPRSSTPPLQFKLKETEELDMDTYDIQQQALQEWLFASIPGERPSNLLTILHRYTLVRGLSFLRQRMDDLVDLHLKLYHKHVCLLSDREVVEGAYLYMGWCLSSFPADKLQGMSRERLGRLLWQNVAEYDDIAKSVRVWKKKIDDRIRRNGNSER